VVRILDPAEGLPKNSTGKILKHLLRSRAKEEVETMRGDKT
jgi:acyl-coenzyme A synthetase/AMP-(fatty) acid ligase